MPGTEATKLRVCAAHLPRVALMHPVALPEGPDPEYQLEHAHEAFGYKLAIVFFTIIEDMQVVEIR